jgi:hypothetical protein
MLKVHAAFRREYALIPPLVRAAAGTDAGRAQIVASHIRLVNLLLHLHHSSEDAVLWPLLLARAPKETDPVVHLMQDQHQGIEAALREAGARLDTWDADATRGETEALAVALERLDAALAEHMALEERLALPVIERHVFASEYEQIHSGEGADVPRDFAGVMAGMLMYEGGLEVIPAGLREFVAEAGPTAYAAHCERVHGTAVPPRSTDIATAARAEARSGLR